MLRLLSLNSVARPGARGVRYPKVRTVYVRSFAALLFFLLAGACQSGPKLAEGFEGEYYYSNGFGHTRVTLERNCRYEYETGGCLGVYDRARGSCQTPQMRAIIAAIARDARYPEFKRPIYLDFYLIKWGERHYLIDSKAMPLFCAYVAAKDDPNQCVQAPFLLKLIDEKKPLSDEVNIPPLWKGYYEQVKTCMPTPKDALAGAGPIPAEWREYYRQKKRWGT